MKVRAQVVIESDDDDDHQSPAVHEVAQIDRHADGTEEWMAHFNDPEGRPLAIMSQMKP